MTSRYIHHTLFGHEGERCVVIDKQEILVDGYSPETRTIYQFYGCKWHRCPCTCASPVSLTDPESEERYQKILDLENRIRSSGYNVVSVWECENPEPALRQLTPGPNSKLGKKFFPYPHFIVYDFEALLRKRNWHRTQDLTIDCSHIPVSVTINDSLTQEPNLHREPWP